MSLKGLRFTLEVDGLNPKTFAVVNFQLKQRHSFPFVLDVDVASGSFSETAENLKASTYLYQEAIVSLKGLRFMPEGDALRPKTFVATNFLLKQGHSQPKGHQTRHRLCW
ncbi:TPA: hypothetical protein N3A33_001816 [Salmonella enterica subsp. salamae serovar 28:r:e,n,z15]|nr:hypothetical protein [Salmonella enterica subsp. salamae serovar 28:r:e,n,z15]